MKKPHLPAIRDILREHASGMTAHEIHALMPHINRATTIKSSLRRMPDAYVDRWTLNDGARGQYEAVWCVVVPPENCPYPTGRFVYQPRTQWVTAPPDAARQ
jgi:hypothetical protein